MALAPHNHGIRSGFLSKGPSERSLLSVRLLVDGPQAGSWNMAVDEAIWLAAQSGVQCKSTLRLYTWSEPTLSLGYFQSHQLVPESFAQVPVVRRLTGGGAILHDREQTYSLTCPAGLWPWPTRAGMVAEFHRLLMKMIPELCFGDPDRAREDQFFCFLRRGSSDLLFGADKVVGSAQRISRGTLLQHGSILWRASPMAPALRGLNWSDAKPLAAFSARLARAFEDQCGWSLEPGSLVESELAKARKLLRDRYSNPEWNRRR